MRSGRTNIYWDTCAFIAWLTDEKCWPSSVMQGLQDVADLVMSDEALLLTSTLVRTEIFMGNLTLEQQQKLAGLLQRRNVQEKSPDIRITDRASAIREHHNRRGNKIKTPDAIHLATAIIYRAHEFHTMDGLDPASGKCNNGLLALNGDVQGYKLFITAPYRRPKTTYQPSMNIALPSELLQESIQYPPHDEAHEEERED